MNKADNLNVEQAEIIVPSTISSSNTNNPSNKTCKSSCTISPISAHTFCWGLLSQITLIMTFIFIELSNNHRMFVLYPWMSLLGCSILHILCNFIFYRKYIIPAYEKKNDDTKTSILIESDEEEEAIIAPPNTLAATYRVLSVFIMIIFVVSNTVRLSFNLE